MIRFELLLLLAITAKFCGISVANEDDFQCSVDFNIHVSNEGRFCDDFESSTQQIDFQYRIIPGNWIFLESYATNGTIQEFNVSNKGTSETELQFRWIQNNTLESPAWTIDDIMISCLLNSYSCYKSISFEETSETLVTSLLECHSGLIHQGTANCSVTENSLLMNGSERELRTTPFTFSNCDNSVNKLFLNTCKECDEERLFNATWPQSYTGTQLTLPCVISEGNVTRLCNSRGIWTPSPIDTFNRCASNKLVCLGPSLSHGFIWSTTQVNETARMQCSEISGVFWSGLYATRKCLNDGAWDEVDMSQCTMRDNKTALIIYSTHLNITDNGLHSSSQINNTELQQLFTNLKINSKLTVVDTEAVLVIELTNNLSTMLNIGGSINRNFKRFHVKDFVPSEIVQMIPDGVCHCNSAISISGEAYLRVLVTKICTGSPYPPCVYDGSKLSNKCNRPYYAGNDTICGQDTDQDGIPDINLGCDGMSCQEDICPWIYDSDNQNVCTVETGCKKEIDKYFGIRWPRTRKNFTVQQACPNGTGITSRFCNHLSEWDKQPPDVRSCSSFVYQELLQNTNLLAGNAASEINGDLVEKALNNLANLVTPSNYSIFPLDINTTHFVISKLLDVVEMAPNLLDEDLDNTSVGILSDMLTIKNKPGYKQLADISRTVNQMLITNSEKLAFLLANNSDSNKTFVKENIVLSIEKRNASSHDDSLIFPLKDSLDRYDGTVVSSSIKIPESVIQQRSANSSVPIANIIYHNLETFLPRTENLSNPDNNTHIPHSVVISSQVGNTNSSVPSNDPVVLEFHYHAASDATNIRCAFWNFDLKQNGGDGGWDITNITVAYKNDTFIRCNSTHLTCFAVLVDIHQAPIKEALALSVVSYFGCGISMLGLLAAISLIVFHRNTILKEIHNFVHLNLAIALFLALTVFVAGIETANKNKIACTVVAALLHYLFTAVFSWMLCEGILLYILLVKVFSTGIVKKKWTYFFLGWGIPLPIVAIAVGIAHNGYGNDEFCWISIHDGVMWAFVGPMLLIILLNIIFLIMVLRILLKSKLKRRTTEEIKQKDIVKLTLLINIVLFIYLSIIYYRSMVKATILLLPLLGLTWVFGLLTVNEHLTVFTWLFTVLNSLQGLLIFVFHVIRNEKVRNMIRNTTVFKAIKYLISAKDRVTYAKYKTGTNTKSGIIKQSSADKENGSNRQVDPIKTSPSSQSSELQQQTNSTDDTELQQQTNSTDDILCTAV